MNLKVHKVTARNSVVFHFDEGRHREKHRHNISNQGWRDQSFVGKVKEAFSKKG